MMAPSMSLLKCALLQLAAHSLRVSGAGRKRSNVVIVYADDFGFDIGGFGHPTVVTPELDRMIREGAKLTQYYSGENVCTPSRGAVLTGRHAARLGLIVDVPWGQCSDSDGVCSDVLHPNNRGHLPTGEITLGEALKAAPGLNYSTAALSKWHLGYSLVNGTDQRFLPTERGFDFFHGTPATHCESGGAWPAEPVFNTSCDEQACPGPTTVVGRLDVYGKNASHLPWSHSQGTSNLTQSYTEYGVNFIERACAAQRPFFLYAAFDSTHGGIYYSAEYVKASRRGELGSATMELDWAVGQLLEAVREGGAAQETVVWFAGDHGPNTASWGSTTEFGSQSVFGGEWAKNAQWQAAHRAGHGSSSVETYLDTAKAGTWEGGHRTAAIVWAPGLVKEATTIRAVVSSLDIFVTTLSLAGIALPTGRQYDGKDLTPLLAGETGADETPHEWFFYFTTCTERMGCPPANLTGASAALGKALPSDRIVAVREAAGPIKCHWLTHSGQGNEPYVRHDPPLCFNVERDPGEKEPLTERSWDGVGCSNRGQGWGLPSQAGSANATYTGNCLQAFAARAYAAVAAKHATLKWCEFCAADGVAGRSMLSATVDYRVMDCRGLNAAESGCCAREGGRCDA